MTWFRRRQPLPAAPADPAPPVVELVGIAASSLNDPSLWMYEFQTEDGTWVRLHDMRFLDAEVRVRPRTLTLRFVDDDDPGRAAAHPAPAAVLRFSDVRILSWEDDPDLVGVPESAFGQVGDFVFFPPRGVFTLSTLVTDLVFTATRVEVTLEPVAPR
ncbi:MAG TPA: hypothetical protein VGC57_04305 [Cellulomonas sp.]